MSGHTFPLPDLVVPSGQVNSNTLLSAGAPVAPNMATDGFGFRDADFITIYGPATLPEVAAVQVAEAEVGGTPVTLRRNGADVTVVAGRAETIDGISFKAIRIALGGAAAATRTFRVTKGLWV